MTNIAETFDRLEKYVVTTFQQNTTLLDEAKELFELSIDSNRNIESASSIEHLLTLLRRQGRWRADSVHSFRMFRKLIQKSEFDDLVESLSAMQRDQSVSKSGKNIYAERRKIQPVNIDETANNNLIPVTFKSPIEKREEVFVIIAGGLSLSEVRSLARHLLELDETAIKNIEFKWGDRGAMKVLSLYEQTSKASLKKILKVLRIGVLRPDLVDKINMLFKS